MLCCWGLAAALQPAALQVRLLLRSSNAFLLPLSRQQPSVAPALLLVGGACRSWAAAGSSSSTVPVVVSGPQLPQGRTGPWTGLRMGTQQQRPLVLQASQ